MRRATGLSKWFIHPSKALNDPESCEREENSISASLHAEFPDLYDENFAPHRRVQTRIDSQHFWIAG
jgi:hypothetical protein